MFNLWETITTKSSEIVDIYKKDLTEFATSIGQQTGDLIQNTVTIIEKKLDEGPLEKLQNDPNTYLNPIDTEEFKEWKKTFQLDSKTEEISTLLQQNPTIKKQHESLIGEKLSYSDFWERYFYNYHLFLKNEKEKEKKKVELDAWDDEEKGPESELREEISILKNQLQKEKDLSKQKDEKYEKLEQEFTLLKQSIQENDLQKFLDEKDKKIKALQEEIEKLKKTTPDEIKIEEKEEENWE